jgi:multimeric flavodoxin WrbA
MRIICIFDGDARTALSEDLRTRLSRIALEKGLETFGIELRKAAIPPCTGCLTCVTKHPGACVYGKVFEDISRKVSGHPYVFFITPVMFGTFSGPVKHIIDRGGLIIKNNAACTQVVIGYADDASAEERSTFIDITAKHRGKVDIVHPKFNERVEVFFTGSAEDNGSIYERVAALLRQGETDAKDLSH